MNPLNRAAANGATFSGIQPTLNPERLKALSDGGYLRWDDKRLARITVLRLLGSPGWPNWDVSYCHGEDVDGKPCRVVLPFSEIPRRGRITTHLIAEAKHAGVYAKGLGLFDAISTVG